MPSSLIRRVHVLLSQALGRSPFSSTTLLAGSGRSGTTWVGNIINHRHDHAVFFEPMHHEKVPEFRHFRNRQYIRPGDTDEQFDAPIERLLRGRVASRWVHAQNTCPTATKLLIKEIRGNLLLGWLSRAYPEVRIVLLVRHPCAVALSRMKLKWRPFPDAFLSQPLLMQDWLEPFRDLLEAPGDEFQSQVTCWCVENYVPLRQLAPDAVHLCFYENFVLSPESEVTRLMGFLNASGPDNLSAVLDERSHTNWNRREGAAPVFNDWTSSVAGEDRARTRDVMARFGLDAWYDEDGRPTARGAMS